MLNTKKEHEGFIVSMLQKADDYQLYRMVCGFIAGYMSHKGNSNLQNYPEWFNVCNEMYLNNNIKEKQGNEHHVSVRERAEPSQGNAIYKSSHRIGQKASRGGD